jgi:hypothetical protein
MQSVSVRFGCGRDKLRILMNLQLILLLLSLLMAEVQSKLPKNFNTKKKLKIFK